MHKRRKRFRRFRSAQHAAEVLHFSLHRSLYGRCQFRLHQALGRAHRSSRQGNQPGRLLRDMGLQCIGSEYLIDQPQFLRLCRTERFAKQ